MSTQRWILVIGLIALFVSAKAWIFSHPKSIVGIIVGAFLLILTESSEAH